MNLLLVTSTEFVTQDRHLLQASLQAASATSAAVRVATTGAAGSDMLARFPFDGIFLFGPLDDCSLELMLEEALRLGSGAPVVVRCREGSVAQAIRIMQSGAAHFFGPDTLGTDHEADRLISMLLSMRRRIDGRATEEAWLKLLVGQSMAMQNVAQVIRLVASRRCNVLVTGETGTGKEMAARAIHAASSRAQQRLIAVNCSALPENLLEAELFGHTKGAFTGAQALRIGRFEEANKSTLFLDEIADLPVGVQTKLLRILQEREVQRLGSSESIKVDFRLIAACNVNLENRIHAGEFREDLYYRLNTVPLRMPALRDRREDIPLLVRHFLHKVCTQEGIDVKRVSDETMDRLSIQNWPGNVRQLENSVEMAVALSGDRETLHPHDFNLASPATFRGNLTAMPAPGGTTEGLLAASEAITAEDYFSRVSVPDGGLDYEQVVGDFERQIIRQALQRTNGNKKAAADILRLKRTTLNAKLKSLEAVAS
jgi:DNA-binding NtrC family response regulator